MTDSDGPDHAATTHRDALSMIGALILIGWPLSVVHAAKNNKNN